MSMTGSTGTPCESAQIDSIELLEDMLEFVPDGFNQLYVVKRPDFHDGATQHSRFDRELRVGPSFFRAALTPSNDHNHAGVGCNPRQLSTEGQRGIPHRMQRAREIRRCSDGSDWRLFRTP